MTVLTVDMELLSIGKSAEVLHFIPIPVTSVAVTNATSSLFTDMQFFNVTFHQNSKLDSLRLGLTFQIENPLSCRRAWKVDLWNIYKNTISQDSCSTVTVNKHTIIDEKITAVLEKISFLAMGDWIQCCINFNLFTWCSVLYFFLFIVHYLLTFKHSNLPVKFASQLSSQKIFKKSGFNFFTHLLVFTVSQTWQHNLSWKKLNKQQYGAKVHDLNK